MAPPRSTSAPVLESTTRRLFATSDHRSIDVAADAAEWGNEVVAVLPHGQIGTHLLSTPDATARAARALSSFDPERDMLLLIGDPVKIALCAALLAAQGIIRFTALRFDRVHNRYFPVDIDLSEHSRICPHS